MKRESGLIRDELIRLIGAPFEIMPVRRDFPAKSEDVEWYIKCSEWRYRNKSAHANMAWKDRTGTIRIEALGTGDTFELVQGFYGDKAAMSASEVDFTSFESRKTLDWFKEFYPAVAQQLNRYREILEKISETHGIPLELRFDPGNGIVFYSIRARIDLAKLGLKEGLSMVEPAVKALLYAFEAIGELDLKARAPE